MAFTCCGREKAITLFDRLGSSESEITFNNRIDENDSTHSFINEFGYMGGGVGIGDFNNDGLKDIYFTGNQVSSKLYLNKGGNKFEDMTQMSGTSTTSWATGVSIADVSNDGFDDIYVCVFGRNLSQRAKNLLFINQHNSTFKEEAEKYGLADSSYSTQAAFFDYDRDGDLDMYLANYLLNGPNANTIYPRDRSGFSPANDRLYRNDGDSAKAGHPVFKDVSLEAGIKEDGYGLGLSISDFNNDGWPDIYVANDFVSNDELWLNNKNGTFTNTIARSIQHQSYSSMGSDAADLNNDGLTDIVTLDMLPEDNERKKTTFFFMNYERYQSERSMGYEPEFMRNMLQLNRGIQPEGDTALPVFSEIGQLAGISSTDWSWSVLSADFNNDGWKDLHITNGIGRDFINADFLEFSSQVAVDGNDRREQEKLIRKKLSDLDHVNLKNYLFVNDSGYRFTNQSETMGIDEPSMSNGAAYADLDNDGDLDLVVNNINSEAFVFVNNSHQHYLRVKLEGDSLNRRGIGAKILLYADGRTQMQEQFPVRGYFSSVDPDPVFGLGNKSRVDSLVIVWPDGKTTVERKVTADTTVVAKRVDLTTPQVMPSASVLFKDITSTSGVNFLHRDNIYNDFAVQRLLPQKYSQLGPFLATADVDKNSSIDFFTGNGFNFSGQLFYRDGNSFRAKNLTDSIKMEEDEASVFFDADADGDPDLLVTSGDVQYSDTSRHYHPRLYLNDGKGNFSLDANAIPPQVKTIAGCVSVGDFNRDGKPDLFIGGRVSRTYPLAPRSFLLQNLGGRFMDVTESVCPSLLNPGMVTAASWVDFDRDGLQDLVIAGDWMPVRIFRNTGKQLKEQALSGEMKANSGMWRSLVTADVDGDGDDDIVAGNLGLNCTYEAGPERPMELFAADIDNNGTIDPLFFYHIKDQEGRFSSFPAASRSQLADQVPAIKKKFLAYSDYAKAGYKEILGNVDESKLLKLRCEETRSCWFENADNGRFVKHALPIEAQFAPVNTILCEDFDGDGIKDLLLAGNEYQAEVVSGRYDASYGAFLKGSRSKTFTSIPPAVSGFFVRGDVKDMKIIPTQDGRKWVLVAVNNDRLRVFEIGTVVK